MPAYLSQGSRHFNQARRIHPKDPIGQLDYYLSSPSSSSRLTQLDSSASSISSQFRDRIPPNDPLKGESPVNSSGFSEEIRAEVSTQGLYLAPAFNQSPLGESNHERSAYKVGELSSKQRRYVTKNIEFPPASGKSSEYSVSRSAESSKQRHVAPRNKQNVSRLKRRNISRINRRMLTLGDENLGNPYALSELFSQSEIPGFREIFASDSYLRKFCWIVAFLFMTFLSLKDMTELITEFFEYPITVDVRLRDSARLPFPSVTVCNLNVVRFSSLCSSGPNTKFDVTNQIPSELRDKLCGIQVEKTNNTETDINDINNIGITTTSTTTTQPTTTIAAASTTPNVTLRPATSEVPILSEDELNKLIATTPHPSASGQETTRSPETTGTTHKTNQAEHKNDPAAKGDKPAGSTTPAPSQSTRRPPGALDLGDFSDPALLVMGRKGRHLPRFGSRGRRSIKLTDSGGPVDDEAHHRPFASSKSRIRVRQSHHNADSVPHDPNEEAQDTLRRLFNPKYQQRQSASQFNKQPNNVLANRVNPPPSRNGFVVPNSFNNANNNNNNNKDDTKDNFMINGVQNPFAASTQPPTPNVPQSNATNFNMPIIPEDFELTERQERELQENLTNWLAVMNNRDSKLTKSLGHQFDDMILRCTMKSINCTHQRSFEDSFTPTEGNCFTYRSRIKRKSSLSGSSGGSKYEEANLAGINHGLELVLNLEKNEYISGSAQVGALVMIHHPSDLGYAASEATFIAPEYTTYIGLKMVNITRLPEPYPEHCVDSWPNKFADKLTKNSTYSQQACLKICLQKTIQSHCQCQSAFLPIVELDSHPSSKSANSSDLNESQSPSSENATINSSQRIIICDTRILHTRQCVREVMFRAADRVHHCECPPKCQVIRYDKTISMARWPTREDKVTFDRGKMDVNFQNLAKVIVYFQTMTCEEVTQQAVFNAAKLFSALGGIMGMYVGFSFLSVFEIFEVMSRKLWHYFTLKVYNTTSRLIGQRRG